MKEVLMPRSTRDLEFSAFVQAHRIEFLRAARLLTAGDTHLAEDLVQTALTKVYLVWPRMRDRPVAYVHRVIVNAHIDETRRPRWRRERSVSEPPEPARTGALSSSSSSGSFGGLADGEAVRTALASLPPRMRAAVVLRHWLDLSVEESADLLGCSTGTVKSQTAKGVARLRDLLGSSQPAVTHERSS
jgi:RNA polymerase sigma-70 factor (sigma-E family)